MKIGRTANGGAFLTTLELDLKIPTAVTIEFKDYIVQAKVKELLISNYHQGQKKIDNEHLDVIFQSVKKMGSPLSKLKAIINFRSETEKDFSLFRARSLRLFTSSQIPLLSNGNMIAKTPQLIETSDDVLRLIVGKKTGLEQ
jgi:hypothetical protein